MSLWESIAQEVAAGRLSATWTTAELCANRELCLHYEQSSLRTMPPNESVSIPGLGLGIGFHANKNAPRAWRVGKRNRALLYSIDGTEVSSVLGTGGRTDYPARKPIVKSSDLGPTIINRNLMTPQEYLTRRNAYAYPVVGLEGTCEGYAHTAFTTIRSMDDHHRSLLRSLDDDMCVLGYLSVIYWGHYSGQDQIIRAPRALGKVRLAKDGASTERHGEATRIRGVTELGVNTVAARIRAATVLVDRGSYGDALRLLVTLPQLQFAFASKVCAFLLPEQCGVIDSVIAAAHQEFGFDVDRNGYVRTNSKNVRSYNQYCAFLSNKAQALNAMGPQFQWRDLDGTLCRWRAADVERAMY